MLEKKYFISQFQDISPDKFARRQRFLRRREGRMYYKNLLARRKKHIRTRPLNY